MRLLLLLTLLTSNPQVDLHLSPRQGFSPATINARVTIEPNESNREACLQWDSEDEFATPGQDCWPLAGAEAPRTSFKVIKDLGPGTYGVRVAVTNVIKPLFTPSYSILVIPSR